MPEPDDAEGAPLEFWFDYSSPYAYFALPGLRRLAERHARRVLWRPLLVGIVSRENGATPATRQPMRWPYIQRDWERLSAALKVPYRLPRPFPVKATAASRMTLWTEAHAPERVGSLARALFEALFAHGIDIGDPAKAAEVGAAVGLAPGDLLEAGSSAEWRDALVARNEEAVRRGIFGSPFLIADGEPFWGCDRLAMADAWLARAG